MANKARTQTRAFSENTIWHRLFVHERKTVVFVFIGALIIGAIVVYGQLKKERIQADTPLSEQQKTAREYFEKVEAIHGLSGTVISTDSKNNTLTFEVTTPLNDAPQRRTARIMPETMFSYTAFVRDKKGNVKVEQKEIIDLSDIAAGATIVVSSDDDIKIAKEFIANNIQIMVPLEK